MSSKETRRRFLEAAGIAGVAALAGCSGNGDGDGGAPIHAVAGERPDLSEAELDDIADAIERGGR